MGLVGFITELIAERPVVGTDSEEVAANTWRLSRSEGDGLAEAADVEQAIRQLATSWLSQAKEVAPGVPITFYVWYDEQAGQLRLSLTSRPPSNLPFEATVQLQQSLRSIVDLALVDPLPGVVMWSELEVASGDAADDDPFTGPLQVWVATS